jgi:hypothetical protein
MRGQTVFTIRSPLGIVPADSVDENSRTEVQNVRDESAASGHGFLACVPAVPLRPTAPEGYSPARVHHRQSCVSFARNRIVNVVARRSEYGEAQQLAKRLLQRLRDLGVAVEVKAA